LPVMYDIAGSGFPLRLREFGGVFK